MFWVFDAVRATSLKHGPKRRSARERPAWAMPSASCWCRVRDIARAAARHVVVAASTKYAVLMSQPIGEVDPAELRLPPSRAAGVDPWKLHQQIRQFGTSKDGMPPVLVYQDPDGVMEIIDGVTRATRIAKLAPGTTVPVIVIGQYRRSRTKSLTVRDLI